MDVAFDGVSSIFNMKQDNGGIMFFLVDEHQVCSIYAFGLEAFKMYHVIEAFFLMNSFRIS